MADFLVMTIDKGSVESGYKKGDIVEVFPDGRLQPQPPNVPFVLIRVPGLAIDKTLQAEWRQQVGFTVVASSAQGYRIKVFAKTVRASDNLGGLTRTQVETYLAKYGASVVSATTNSVTFDVPKASAQDLKDDLIQRLNNFVRRRMYHVPATAVDAALANGGVMTYTSTQVATYLKRKAD